MWTSSSPFCTWYHFFPCLTQTRLQALLRESSFSLVLLQSQAQWSRPHCLGTRGKVILSEVERKRLKKQHWFIKQWICINYSCVLYQFCLFRIWTMFSFLSWNKQKKQPISIYYLATGIFSLIFHFWTTIIGFHCETNLIIHRTRPSSLISAASLSIWSENTTVWYHHIKHTICAESLQANNKQQKHDENVSFASIYTHSLQNVQISPK